MQKVHLIPPAFLSETACGRYGVQRWTRLASRVTCQRCKRTSDYDLQEYLEEKRASQEAQEVN